MSRIAFTRLQWWLARRADTRLRLKQRDPSKTGLVAAAQNRGRRRASAEKRWGNGGK